MISQNKELNLIFVRTLNLLRKNAARKYQKLKSINLFMLMRNNIKSLTKSKRIKNFYNNPEVRTELNNIINKSLNYVLFNILLLIS